MPDKKEQTRSPIKLLTLVKPHWKIFIVAMLTLAGGSGVNLAFPELLRRLLEPEYVSLLSKEPILVGLGVTALFAFQGICFYYRSYIFGVIGQRVVAKLRSDLYSALIRQNIEFFDRERVGDLVSRLGSDTLMIQDAVSIKLSVFIRYSFQVAVGIGMMLYLSFKLTLTILLSLPVLVLISIVLGKRLKQYSKIQQSELAASSVIAEETFGAVRIVKAFNREDFERSRYGASNERTLKAGLGRTALSAFFSSFVSFLMNVSIVVVVLYGMFLVGKGGLSTGDLTAFLLYGVIVAVSFAFVAGGYGEFVQAIGAAERVFELLTPSSATKALEDLSLKKIADLKNKDLQFDRITFNYPTRPEVPVLSDISFKIEHGKKTALVGPSGSGKSTIVSLILGFYAPTSGKIQIGDSSLETFSVVDLRNHIAVVPQDPQLFAVSIGENLKYGKLDATQAELESVCQSVNLLDFIRSLPEGFSTNVGEKGVQLSGGQKQRLAIARAMLRNPDLLLLDEATSSLDSENERLVQNALAKLMDGRTALVIAHRLSTIQDAAQVIVLEHGKVIQRGTHNELSSRAGLYKQLVEKQELK